MATRVTDGARRERHALVSRVSRLRRSRARALLSGLNLKKKRDCSQSLQHCFFFQRDGESFLSEPDFRGKYSKIRLTRCIFLNLFAQDCRLVTGARWPSAAGRCSFLTISQKNREIVECVQSNHNNSVEIFFLCRL